VPNGRALSSEERRGGSSTILSMLVKISNLAFKPCNNEGLEKWYRIMEKPETISDSQDLASD